MPEKRCAVVYDQRMREYCRKAATTFSRRGWATSYYCAEHGREHGALDLDPTDTARAAAEGRAHDCLSPDLAIEPTAAVNLYVEAFVVGARFGANRLDGSR